MVLPKKTKKDLVGHLVAIMTALMPSKKADFDKLNSISSTWMTFWFRRAFSLHDDEILMIVTLSVESCESMQQIRVTTDKAHHSLSLISVFGQFTGSHFPLGL